MRPLAGEFAVEDQCLKLAVHRALGVVLLAVCPLAAGDLGANLVWPPEVVSQPERTQVTLRFDQPFRYKTGRAHEPERVYVDLLDVSFRANASVPVVPSDDSLVKQVRIGRRAPNVARLVIELNSGANLSVAASMNPPRLLVILTAERITRTFEPPRSTTGVAGLAAAREPNPLIEAPLPVPGVVGLPPFMPLPLSLLPLHAPEPPAIASAAPAPVVPAGPPPAPSGVITPAAPAKANDTRLLNIPRTTQPLRIEDFLDGQPHTQAAEVRDFRQNEPHDGSPISAATAAYLAYDDKRLYVVFVCHDDPQLTRAHMTKREDVDGDDLVAVYLDTFHDRRRAYVFESNPLGIQRDSILTEGEKRADYNFDTIWESDGHLTSFGFVVEFSIPFKSLRFSGAAAQQWGIALARHIPHNNEDSFWPYITGKVQGFVQQMAELNGLEKISPGRNVRLIPYITASNSRFLDAGPGLTTSNDIRGGVDGKMILKDVLTLDFTANPDFSQVESDDPQVTVNRRYEVFYPEKRPFFLDNAAYFSTPVNLFYSRRIVDPNAGARLSGKVGPWAIGLLATDDRTPGQSVDPSDPLHGDLTSIGVARIAREFGQQSSAGMFFSDREFGSSFNRVYSLDTRLKLTDNWSLKAQVIHSDDRQLDGTRKQGSALSLEAVYSDRHFAYAGSYTGFGPGFRAPLGFVQRVDNRQGSQYASYLWKPESGIVTSFGPTFKAAVIYDHTGRLTDWSGGAQFDIWFRGPTHLSSYRYQSYEYYLGQGFHKATNGLSFYTAWMKWLDLYGTYTQGDAINYSPPYPLQSFLGASETASFGAAVHLPRLQLEQYYLFTRLGGEGTSGGLNVFNNHIARSKLNYQFTRALSLRSIIDYYAQLPNESLVRQTHFKQITTDVLLTYLIHPGTAAYLGYTNRFQNLGLDPTHPSALVPRGPPTFQTDRLLFVKLSYLLHF